MEIGTKLKEAREARGLTLDAVEEETKIRRKYLKALEEEQFSVLPGAIYAKAFLKNYAKFLNLDVDEVLESYNNSCALEIPAEKLPQEQPQVKASIDISSKPRYRLFIAVAAILIVMGFSVFYILGSMATPDDTARVDQQEQSAQTPPPAGEDSGKPSVQETEPGVNLVLNVKESRSWIQVVVDGNPAYQGTVTAGESVIFDAKSKISIRLGNAGAVEVLVNGKNLGYLGGTGEVVNREFTTLTSG